MLKMMKYLLHTLSCLLLFAAGTCLAQTPGHTLRSGGIDRTYRLHLPEGLPDARRWSLSSTATEDRATRNGST